MKDIIAAGAGMFGAVMLGPSEPLVIGASVSLVGVGASFWCSGRRSLGRALIIVGFGVSAVIGLHLIQADHVVPMLMLVLASIVYSGRRSHVV